MTPVNRLSHYKIKVTCHKHVTIEMISKLVREAQLRFHLVAHSDLLAVSLEPTAMLAGSTEFCFVMRYFGRSEKAASIAIKEFEATFEHLDRIKFVKFRGSPAFRVALSVTSHSQL